jgi:hypothetical protein
MCLHELPNDAAQDESFYPRADPFIVQEQGGLNQPRSRIAPETGTHSPRIS